jgi:signal transduction histidine kinase
MSSRAHGTLGRRYAAQLRKYLAHEEEALLEAAYALGRAAIAAGAGILDMAHIHRQALQKALRPGSTIQGNRPAFQAAEVFFLESLSPFEATHRGFRETNLKLQQVIGTLEKRNRDLAVSNRDLAGEIQQRRRTEKALRKSELHFRALFNEARRMEGNLRSLSNQILHAQEQERKRISRELHDEVGQALTAVSVTLATLKNARHDTVSLIGPKLADAQKLLQESMEAVHGFARELRPTILDELGLVPALRSCLNAFAERTGLVVRLRANPIAEQLNGEQKTVLFRVAQESLTNVAKHAEASQVEIVIRKAGDGVCMEVADNGKSFREKPPAKGKQGTRRLGLLGMQERARLVNGTFAVKAQPGRGTTIRVVIPFKSPSSLILSKKLQDAQRAPSPRAGANVARGRAAAASPAPSDIKTGSGTDSDTDTDAVSPLRLNGANPQ